MNKKKGNIYAKPLVLIFFPFSFVFSLSFLTEKHDQLSTNLCHDPQNLSVT